MSGANQNSGNRAANTATASKAPAIEQLHKLQLFRTTLVSFLGWRNFSEAVSGCYVRVLLEMRNNNDDTAEVSTTNDNHYYIALVKGAQLGPAYSGFSIDGAKTEWHIIIELPPCFKPTQNGNIVQLNSISNSLFRQSEYNYWVESNSAAVGRSHTKFPTMAQLQFRQGMLEEHKQQALMPVPKAKKNEDPKVTEQREAFIAKKREEIKTEIANDYYHFPTMDQLSVKSTEELQELERLVLDLINQTRVAISEKNKCMNCKKNTSTVVCYPCRHQVLCEHCANVMKENNATRCPAPGCTVPITKIITPFT